VALRRGRRPNEIAFPVLGANTMRKNSHKSQVANTSGAWSSSAIICDLKDSRGQLSGVHTDPPKGSTTGRPRGNRLRLQPRYPEPVDDPTCVCFSPHQGHRGCVKPLTPCGSALEIYRPPPSLRTSLRVSSPRNASLGSIDEPFSREFTRTPVPPGNMSKPAETNTGDQSHALHQQR
jgi:hypothetical protein